MSILAFDPKELAEKLATEEASVVKVYEVLLKAVTDKLERKVYCWQRPTDGWLLIEDGNVVDYVENVVGMLEKETSTKWTDDVVFFEVADILEEMSETLTGDLE